MKKLAKFVFFTLFTASPAYADICYDRPGNGIAPCTIGAGTFQIETNMISFASQKLDGVSTLQTVIAEPEFKYGLTNNIDIQIDIPLHEKIVTKSNGKTIVSGMGDIVVSGKWGILNNSKWQMAISPSVKLPTAGNELGNGAVEGGIAVPLQYTFAKNWTFQVAPEIDILRNANDLGYHENFQSMLNVSHNLNERWSVGAEIWFDYNSDHTSFYECSTDFMIAYAPQLGIQLDAGVNFSLNKYTPSQMYLGFSKRF